MGRLGRSVLLVCATLPGWTPAEAQERPGASPVATDESLTVLGRRTPYQAAPTPADDGAGDEDRAGGEPDGLAGDVGLPAVGNVSVVVTMRVARFGWPPPVVAVSDASIEPTHNAFTVRLAADGSLEPASLPVIDRAVHAPLSIRDIVIDIVPSGEVPDAVARTRTLRTVGLACIRSGAHPLDLVSDGRPVFAGLPTAEAGLRSVRTLSLSVHDRRHPAG